MGTTGYSNGTKQGDHLETEKGVRLSHSHRFVSELLEKKKLEEMEEKERIDHLRWRAREVPPSTYEPRFQQLLEKEEKAREARRQKAAEMLQKVRLTWTVAKLEPESFHLRRCVSAEVFDKRKHELFKAKEVPLSVYLPPYKDVIRATKRSRRKAERAAELMRTSKAPPGLEEHAVRSKVQYNLRHAKHCTDLKPKHNVKHSRTVPNFKKLHEQFMLKLEKAAMNRPLTIIAPFTFQTDERIHSHKCYQECPTKKTYRRSNSVGNLREYNGPGIRLNHASLLRNEANRIRAQKMETELDRSRKFWQSMKEGGDLARVRLKQKLAAKADNCCEIQRRLEEKKKAQRERAVHYRNELEEMKKRVRSRALMVEQQEMLIKIQRFERKYKETIAEAKSVIYMRRKACLKRNGSKSQKITDDQKQRIFAVSDSKNKTTTMEAYNGGSFIVNSDDEEEREKEIEKVYDDGGDKANVNDGFGDDGGYDYGDNDTDDDNDSDSDDDDNSCDDDHDDGRDLNHNDHDDDDDDGSESDNGEEEYDDDSETYTSRSSTQKSSSNK